MTTSGGMSQFSNGLGEAILQAPTPPDINPRPAKRTRYVEPVLASIQQRLMGVKGAGPRDQRSAGSAVLGMPAGSEQGQCTIVSQVNAIKKEILDDRTLLLTRMQKDDLAVLYLTHFLCGATFSGYQMSNIQKLMMVLLIDDDNHRAHEGQVFKYCASGAWVPAETLSIEPWDIFTALEGFLIQISDCSRDRQISAWSWSVAKPIVDMLVRKHSAGFSSFFAKMANSRSDHTRKATRNKPWEACWLERVADMIARVRGTWEHASTSLQLTKLFLQHCEMPFPKSRGVAFKDCYMKEDWTEGTANRDNNCYIKLDYNFYFTKDDLADLGLDLEEARKTLRAFIDSFYYRNGAVFEIKLMAYRCAFARVCTGKILYEISQGGGGKGMEGALERGIFGEKNSATLDCGVFQERSEWRKSGHFAWGMSNVRIQEASEVGVRFLSDIWKRIPVDEEIDLRVNYGLTVKRKFGTSMKVQELNPENIPIVEVSAHATEQPLESIHRRILCLRVGKATLTTDEDIIDEASGIFLRRAQSFLEHFLQHRAVSSMFLQDYCLAFFQEHGVSTCLERFADAANIWPEIGINTHWLAGRLCGGFSDPPWVGDKTGEADELVKCVHKHTPAKAVIKAYVLNKIREIPRNRLSVVVEGQEDESRILRCSCAWRDSQVVPTDW